MTATARKIPALRFPEFEGEWEEKRLGKLCSTFKSGTGITSEHIYGAGEYPVYGGNGLRGYTNSFTHEGFFVLIGRQGALCGNINRIRGKSYISEHAIAVAANETSDTEWLAQKLDYSKLNRLSESSAQPGLAVNKLVNLKLFVPTLPEQQKIAAFLTTVDTRIQQLSRKKALLEQYKKGVMQQIFSQEIRFKDEGGKEFPAWEQLELCEVAVRVLEKNRDNAITFVLTNSATQGIVSQQDYFDKDIANPNNLEGYYVVQIDDFVYNPRISSTAPVGPVKRNKLSKGVMSPLYTVFRFKIHDIQFFEYFFETTQWHFYMKSVANYGIRHDRMNITNADFIKMPIPIPVLEEQQKIAAFLSTLDRQINLVSQQLERMQAFKKGLLQQMFV